ncbi:MAG: hypothetical protein V1819_03490 [bacterium]
MINLNDAIKELGLKCYRVSGVGEFEKTAGNVWAKSEEGAKQTVAHNAGIFKEAEFTSFMATAEVVLIANSPQELEEKRRKSYYYRKIMDLYMS